MKEGLKLFGSWVMIILLALATILLYGIAYGLTYDVVSDWLFAYNLITLPDLPWSLWAIIAAVQNLLSSKSNGTIKLSVSNLGESLVTWLGIMLNLYFKVFIIYLLTLFL